MDEIASAMPILLVLLVIVALLFNAAVVAISRGGTPMTYAIAKLRIWNPDAYTRAEVRDAAMWLLSRLTTRREDIDQSIALLQRLNPTEDRTS